MAAVTGWQIVGVDCAAQNRNVGVALAAHAHDGWEILDLDTRLDDPAGWIVRRVAWDRPVLLALDAPLGWPAELARRLADHGPGGAIDADPNRLFRRRTDHEVRARTGKVPLDVGADRIARAAHGALRLLDDVRSASGRPLRLLWAPPAAETAGVVEVYPAATLRQWGWPDRG